MANEDTRAAKTTADTARQLEAVEREIVELTEGDANIGPAFMPTMLAVLLDTVLKIQAGSDDSLREFLRLRFLREVLARLKKRAAESTPAQATGPRGTP
jgi:hypothetical protein